MNIGTITDADKSRLKKALVGAAVGGVVGRSFTMGGKKMVYDRGRYKQAGNVGSKNEGKSFSPENIYSGAKAIANKPKNQEYIGINRLMDSGHQGLLTEKDVKRAGQEPEKKSGKLGTVRPRWTPPVSRVRDEARRKEIIKGLSKVISSE